MAVRSDDPSPILTPAPQAPGTVITPGGVHGTDPGVDAHVGVATHSAAAVDWLAFAPLLILCLFLALIVILGLISMLSGWRTAAAAAESSGAVRIRAPRHSMTVLVTALHGTAGVDRTLAALQRQTHPDVEVRIIVDGHDDDAVRSAWAATADGNGDRVTVLADDSIPLTRPGSLNRALETSHGDIVGVFEAGDEPDAELLSRVDARFGDDGIAIVQGGVQPKVLTHTWWRVQDAVEQYFWFRSRLLFQERAHAAVLQGTAVFARAEWLFWSNGWDAHSLAEGGELGVRASASGARVAAVYGPGALTRTVGDVSLRRWLTRRTRSNQGIVQLLAGPHRSGPLPRASRLRAGLLLIMPFLEALAAAAIPVVILGSVAARLPSPVILATLIPLAPVAITMAVEIVGLGDLAGQRGTRFSVRDAARVVAGWFPYRYLLFVAAIRSVGRHVFGFGVVGSTRPKRVADGISDDFARPDSTAVGAVR